MDMLIDAHMPQENQRPHDLDVHYRDYIGGLSQKSYRLSFVMYILLLLGSCLSLNRFG